MALCHSAVWPSGWCRRARGTVSGVGPVGVVSWRVFTPCRYPRRVRGRPYRGQRAAVSSSSTTRSMAARTATRIVVSTTASHCALHGPAGCGIVAIGVSPLGAPRQGRHGWWLQLHREDTPFPFSTTIGTPPRTYAAVNLADYAYQYLDEAIALARQRKNLRLLEL